MQGLALMAEIPAYRPEAWSLSQLTSRHDDPQCGEGR